MPDPAQVPQVAGADGVRVSGEGGVLPGIALGGENYSGYNQNEGAND
jgi:hypothetical protein